MNTETQKFEIDGETVVIGCPDGQRYGLYRERFDFDAGRYWEQIPLTYEQTGERDRLRGLRLRAAELSGGDVANAQAIYNFLTAADKLEAALSEKIG